MLLACLKVLPNLTALTVALANKSEPLLSSHVVELEATVVLRVSERSDFSSHTIKNAAGLLLNIRDARSLRYASGHGQQRHKEETQTF